MGADGLPARRPDLEVDGRGRPRSSRKDVFRMLRFGSPKISFQVLEQGICDHVVFPWSVVCAVKLSRLNGEVATIPRTRQGKKC